MNHDEIQAARERVENATPGVWEPVKLTDGWAVMDDRRIMIAEMYTLRDKEDAEFIAHAREDVPKLLDEIENMKKELSRAKIDYEVSHQSKKAEIERLQAKLDDIDRYGTLNEQDWMDEAKRLQEENEVMENTLQKFSKWGVWGTAGAGMLNDTFVRLRELRGEKSE